MNFQNGVKKRLEKASDVESIDEWWTRLKTSITESANENIGVKKGVKAKKDSITGKTFEKMDERRRWKSVNSVEGKKMYRKLNNELRRETDKAREEWWKEECAELERLNKRGKSDELYARIKKLTGEKKTQSKVYALNDENGVSLTQPEKMRNRWKEYIELLYNKESKPASER